MRIFGGAALPTESELRDHRHREILTLLRRSRVASQGEIVERLRVRGIEATQSSVSRDLRDMGVAKVGGRYLAPPLRQGKTEDLRAAAHFLRGTKPAGPHLAVVLTVPGAAQAIGLALDHAQYPEVVGTLAGDDTVFVATASAADQKRFLQRLEALMLEVSP
jgi:transcriptional regulator of arginine metabolism